MMNIFIIANKEDNIIKALNLHTRDLKDFINIQNDIYSLNIINNYLYI